MDLVTKTVEVQSILNPQTTPSSSASPDQSFKVIATVVSVGVTTFKTANCIRLWCSASIAVSKVLYLSLFEQTLILGIVRLRILLASGICKNGVSINSL